MATARQQDLIDRIRVFLLGDSRVDAAWLAGSLGWGGGDAFSDVDILALAGSGTALEVSRSIAERLSAIVRPVLVNRLHGGRVLSVVTAEWDGFDITVVEENDLSQYDATRLTTLYNRSGKTASVRPESPYQVAPETLLALVNEFLRILGLTVVVVGREEYALALSGIEHLRRMTFELMLEENAIPPWRRGGALHRNPLLTAEQQAQFQSVPPLLAERSSILEGHRAFAAVFLPRAKRLAARIGMAWPQEFEAATRTHLESKLRLRISGSDDAVGGE